MAAGIQQTPWKSCKYGTGCAGKMLAEDSGLDVHGGIEAPAEQQQQTSNRIAV